MSFARQFASKVTSGQTILRRYSSNAATKYLVTPQEANELVQHQGAVLLDATWFMPNSPRDPVKEFAEKRLPQARFFNLDKVATPSDKGLMHMMPTGRVFADACEKYGISPNTPVVIYDAHGVFSSPRGLFTFRSFNHENSSILDGGLPRWEAEGLPVETSEPTTPTAVDYPTPELNAKAITSYEQMLSKFTGKDSAEELILDARPKNRFLGIDPEPRPGLRSGHMPGAVSLTFALFLQKNTVNGKEFTTFLPPDKLRQALIDAVGEERAQLIIDGKLPVTTTCGSGMTAAILWLGLRQLGVKDISLYDESWMGYGARESSPVVTSD
ncbi:Rhodanese-like domain-containing protein [Schizophyllum amplum]|uniref:Rhodanese-like domain-containing protein n=1 Tax=Schizophyllum amplum TaxID=97359 RepID=A0A550C9G5_9AGAR|nr:Rhodanese-like domain-containing protein [Auriculariopsis ampla]